MLTRGLMILPALTLGPVVEGTRALLGPGRGVFAVMSDFQDFFRAVQAILRPPSAGSSYGELHGTRRAARPCGPERSLMYDLAAIGIAAACFAFVYLILWALDRV